MARKTTMMPVTNGGGAGRRVLATLVCLVLLVLVVRDPVGAAAVVSQVGRSVDAALDALSAFGAALSR
ncbi:hypothetical protein GCM10010464_35940 [Pseudonocardia yunnanensis]|uniref:Secreted protein n=1 Tax=Pseudonocardia yunnanensis TaxID=58107 RepID=A0ABW4ELR4_9PSEU